MTAMTTAATDGKTPASEDPGSGPSLATTHTAEPKPTIPDGGLRAWLTVLGSTAGVTATFGVINSIGTFQSYLVAHQLHAISERDVGWIPAANIFLCLLLGVQFGPLFDHYGPRWIMAISSVAFVGGMLGMSFLRCDDNVEDRCTPGNELARTYALLMLFWGIICGAAAAAITTTSLAVVAHWFDRRRGLASGVVYAGSSIGGVAFPLLMRETLPHLGWAWSVRIIDLIVVSLLALANVCMRGRHQELRRPPTPTAQLHGGRADNIDSAQDEFSTPIPKKSKRRVLDLSCLWDPRFVWATLGVGMFEFVVSASVGMLPSWAEKRGFGPGAALTFLAVYNAGSLFGRIAAGILSDRFGAINTVMTVLIASMIVIYGLWLPVTVDRLPLFYLFAALFGTTTGSIMSMAPVCISKLCEPRDFGHYLGTCYSIVSFFCLVSIPVSLEILENLGPLLFSVMFGAFLAIAFVAFALARWYCLGRDWQWKVVV